MDNPMNFVKNSNQHAEMLTEEKEKTKQPIELFPKEDKAQQPYVFNFNKCFVSAGDEEDSPSLVIVSREEELLQKEDKTVMSHMQKLVSVSDNKELACLNSQERTVGQHFGSATMLEDEVTMFEELDLIEKINQDDGGQLLKIVKEGGEPKNVAEGQEVWEEATSMVEVAATSMAAVEATSMAAVAATSMVATTTTFMVTVETTLTAEEEALKPYGFYSRNCFVNASIVVSAEEHLTQLSSQIKGKEVLCSRRQEGVDDRVAVRTETSIEARGLPVIVQIKRVKTEHAILAQQTARNQPLGDLLDQEIESIIKLMMTVSRKRPTAVKQRRNSKKKIVEDYEGLVSVAMQHKVWRPGEEQQT